MPTVGSWWTRASCARRVEGGHPQFHSPLPDSPHVTCRCLAACFRTCRPTRCGAAPGFPACRRPCTRCAAGAVSSCVRLSHRLSTQATPSVYGVNDMQQTTPLRGNATAVAGRAEQWQWWCVPRAGGSVFHEAGSLTRHPLPTQALPRHGQDGRGCGGGAAAVPHPGQGVPPAERLPVPGVCTRHCIVFFCSAL